MGTISLNHYGVRTFGPFTFDPDGGELSRDGYRVRLQPQPALVLAILTEQAGKLVSREEIYRAVWGDDTHVDFEQSLNYCIRQIRSALKDDPNDPEFLETIPKRGYRFLGRVEVANGDGSRLSTAVEAPTAEGATGRRKLWKIVVPVAAVVLALSVVEFFYFHRKSALTDKDTIVLADFSNSTGDAIFDDTLKSALSVSLQHSPFLRLLPDSQVAKKLQLMTRPPETKLTPEVTRELCQRAGSKAYVAGSIGSLGSEYVVGLKAINCQSGDTLAQEQVTVASKEKVLNALDKAASKLRTELGESLATVQKFDVPLSNVTSSSLDALQAMSLGVKIENEKGNAEALPYFQRAVELDPNFAMAYRSLAGVYLNLGEQERGREYIAKAFQLRDHAGEREKLRVTSNYYLYVTGELDKAAHTLEEEIEIYHTGYGDLGLVYLELGQYDKAAKIIREDPEVVDFQDAANLSLCALALQHFDEAQQILREAQAQGIDDFTLHFNRYIIGFLRSDAAAMAEQQQWFAGKPDYENIGLELASDTEAYQGHLSKSEELKNRAVDSALRAGQKETAAQIVADTALQQAAYGNTPEARRSATLALKRAPASSYVLTEAALMFAMVGDTSRAESLAKDLGKRFPLDTQMQSLCLPAIQAQIGLHRKNPASALNALQAALPIELASTIHTNYGLLPTYIRAEAYLSAGQGSLAAAEFQKILDHNGIVWNAWTGALAHLGLARANALQARTSQGADADAARVRALTAYRDFLSLWKGADPDVPILKEAKAEYAKLQ